MTSAYYKNYATHLTTLDGNLLILEEMHLAGEAEDYPLGTPKRTHLDTLIELIQNELLRRVY